MAHFPRVLFIFSVLLLWLLLQPVTSTAKPKKEAQKGTEKTEISDSRFRSLKKDLRASRWVIRAFAALEAGKYSDYKVLSRLRISWEKESDRKVQAFLSLAMSTWDNDVLILALPGTVLEKQVDNILYADNEFEGDVAVLLLNKVFKSKYEKNRKGWASVWKKQRKAYPKARERSIKKWTKKHGPLVEDTDDNDDSEDTESVVPNRLDSALRNLENNGVDLAILLDDTGSMGTIIQAAKDGIRSLMAAMDLLSPNFRVGLVTYKDEVNKTQALTNDIERMEKVVNSLSADGGEDFPEAVSLAFYHAYRNFKWREAPVLRMFVLIGDAPCHNKNKAKLLETIAEAAKKGFTFHTVSVQEGSAKGKHVDGFKQFAEKGDGVAIALTDQSILLTEMLTLMFGKEYKEYCAEFCKGLVLLQTPVKSK